MIEESVEFLKSRIGKVDVAVILGSGLGKLAYEVEEAVRIPYSQIPNFLRSTAPGHAGELVYGRVSGKYVLLMNGRFHMYEGYKPRDIVYPVEVMKMIGIKKLIVTNAAGGIKLSFKPGQLVFIKDIINLSFRNPLIGPNDEKVGPRFPDMSSPLSTAWIEKANDAIYESMKERLESGTYASMLGPSYETPAEIRMLRKIGADMVGMSTVPEIIKANHVGIETLGISCVTNMAAGVLPQPLSEKEVLEVANSVSKRFISIVKIIIEKTC
ncbi:purine-nucleoside phosphorylase [Athalassotoga saccharophila]|uniref:purine-nucleoside phosphorylase n=1 Tax=Athalassotoga saccharophila TaxID=1441386 RepID=UPI00137AE690|nr:purine-nucleoside phosphorylase [Athalassotoga saccharophila]BBJ27734.1 purine nucleoside phosphorylase 1 [Athalassotoga saccharophila]